MSVVQKAIETQLKNIQAKTGKGLEELGQFGPAGAFAQKYTVLSILLLHKGVKTDVTKTQFSTLHLLWEA